MDKSFTKQNKSLYAKFYNGIVENSLAANLVPFGGRKVCENMKKPQNILVMTVVIFFELFMPNLTLTLIPLNLTN